MRTSLRHWSRAALGLLLGFGTALCAVGVLLVAVALPRARGGARALVTLERRRMAAFYDTEPGAVPREFGRASGYLAARCGPALLGAAVLVATVLSGLSASFLVWGWFVLPVLDNPLDVLLSACGGLFLLFLAVQGVHGVAALDVRLARRFLGPDGRAELERRIGELAATRAGAVRAVHDERRRIERDLHDGVQQRLVALGLTLGRARRAAPGDPDKSAALLRQAHEESQQALAELREVAWRVYPAALDEGGLAYALETLAERSPVPVALTLALGAEPPPMVRSAAYFVAAEAVTNAAKHAGAARVTLRAESALSVADGTVVRVTVEDDGRGGADPAGGGLVGLARRVAALDGRFEVVSPAGGPTVIMAELPCE